jgi:hypothetical protein
MISDFEAMGPRDRKREAMDAWLVREGRKGDREPRTDAGHAELKRRWYEEWRRAR